MKEPEITEFQGDAIIIDTPMKRIDIIEETLWDRRSIFLMW